MAVTTKILRTGPRPRPAPPALLQRAHALGYGLTLLLVATAIYTIIGLLVGHFQVAIDDLRYGRPRTVQIDGYVGHGETTGRPTHVIAMNLNRQVVVIELPGGDPAAARTLNGPYLFGANEELTPVLLDLQDIDGDGARDLVLTVRRELIVYLNRDGTFRLPTAEEQAQLRSGTEQ